MTLQAPPARPAAPYRPLGAFRLALATLVMIQHAGSLLPRAINDVSGPLEVGSIAVYCFFAVSGFVIAEAAMAFYPGRPVAFLTNRLLRLMPTYVAALVVSALVLAAAAPHFVPAVNESPIPPERFAPRTVAANLLALLPIWKAVQIRLGVPEVLEQGWALRIEFVFYIAVALSLAAARLARVGFGTVVAVLGLAMLLLLTALNGRTEGSTLENAPHFILGVALYFLCTLRRERLVPAVFAITSCLFIATQLLGRASTFGVAAFPRDRVGEFCLLGVLLVLFALLATRVPRPGRGWARAMRFDRALGEITYPLYLMHWAVLIAAKTWLPHHNWVSVGLSFAAALGVSLLTVTAVEAPIAKRRAKLRGRGVTPVARATTQPATSLS